MDPFEQFMKNNERSNESLISKLLTLFWHYSPNTFKRFLRPNDKDCFARHYTPWHLLFVRLAFAYFQEYEDVCFPHRSTSFATSLQHLTLEYYDSITDLDMTDIVTVCQGSLAVIDYYSCDVTPNRLRLGKYKIKTSSNLDVTPSQEWKKKLISHPIVWGLANIN